MLSVRAPVGEVNVTNFECCIGRGLAALEPISSDLKYCFYLLKYFRSRILKTSQGTTFEAINRNDIANVIVLFTNNAHEQQKIASILSKVDELIQKTDQVIEQNQRRKKGLMQRLLKKGIGHTKFSKTSIGDIPEDWKVSSIGCECKLGTGGTPSRSVPHYFGGAIPWVKTTEVHFNLITSSQEHITQQAIEESAAKLYPKGTLLMAMYGEGVTRGKCAILGINAAINQACAAIQSEGRLNVKFIFYWCQLHYNTIRSKSHGTHQSNFNLTFVGAIEIPIPTISEQEKIVSILNNIDSLIDKTCDYKSGLQSLKKALMQKLLTGKIRVNV